MTCKFVKCSILKKGDLISSLDAMYSKRIAKFPSELHKTTNTLFQKLAALGASKDHLEMKCGELSLAYTVMSFLGSTSLFPQLLDFSKQVEDLDNWNRHNNLCIPGVPETINELTPVVTDL